MSPPSRRRLLPLAAVLASGLLVGLPIADTATGPADAQPRPSRPGWDDGSGGDAEDGAPEATSPAADLLLTPGRVFEGREEVDVLVIDPEVRELVFLLDGEAVARRGKPPWRAKLPFAEPARTQTLSLRALGPRDRILSEVSRQVNRFRRPFRARLLRVEAVPAGVRATGEVTLPAGSELERLELGLGGGEPVVVEPASAGADGTIPFEHLFPSRAAGGDTFDPEAFVTVRAVSRGGSQVEDVAFLGHDVAAVDVRLVELQVLVNRRGGPPTRDVAPADFRIREGGRERPVERLVEAADAPLRLGLVIDASGSMVTIWREVRAAVRAFLDHAVGPDDRVFLVSFDSHVRLIRPAAEPGAAAVRNVEEGLGEIEPEGSTALYDSVGFSLLHFLADAARDVGQEAGREAGAERRALVVITDGADVGSQIEPRRAVELAVEHGIPVYVVAIPRLDAGRGRASRQWLAQGAAGADLRLLTDPTGGRVLRAGRGGGLERAFTQITAELRHQLVLTFSTDTDPEQISARKIDVDLPGRPELEARAVVPLDRIR